jgi:hypothetical protein
MPFSLQNLLASEIDIRHKEPFLTEALNTKVGGGITPVGIYRGFQLTTNPTPMNVTVTSLTNSEHTAVLEAAGGESITVRRQGGDFALDLTVAASSTVVIAIQANYTLGNTTQGDIRAFTVAEYDALANYYDLVFLGTVVVPGAGVIPAANISDHRRTRPTDPVERRKGIPLLRNPQFARGDTGLAYGRNALPWQWGSAAIADSWLLPVVSGSALEDSDKVLAVQTVPTTIATLLLSQYCTPPVNQAYLGGVLLQFTVEVLEALTGGTAALFVNWRQLDGSAGSAPAVSLATLLGSVGTDTLRAFVPAPTATDHHISSVGLIMIGATFTGAGTVFQILDFQATAYSRDEVEPDIEEWMRSLETHEVTIWDPSLSSRLSTANTSLAAVLRYAQGADPILSIDRLDSGDPVSNPYPSLQLQGSLRDLGTSVASEDPRVTAPYITAERTLMWASSERGGSGATIRAYLQEGVAEFTINARWNSGTTQWVKDDTALDAYRTRVTVQGIQPQVYTPVGPFAEAAWVDTTLLSFGRAVTDPSLSIKTPNLSVSGDRQLLISFPPIAGATPIAIYKVQGVSSTIWELSVNATWSGTVWNRTVAFRNSYRISLDPSEGFKVSFYDSSDADGWLEAAWNHNHELRTLEPVSGGQAARAQFVNGQVLFTSGDFTNQIGEAPEPHALYSVNTPKAFATISMVLGTPTFQQHFGFVPGSTSVVGTTLTLTLDNAMNGSDYCVVANHLLANPLGVTPVTSTTLAIGLNNFAGAAINWSTVTTAVFVMVMGRQP